MLHEFNEPSPHINLNGERRHKFGFVTNIPAEFFIRCLRITKMFETEQVGWPKFLWYFVTKIVLTYSEKKLF